FVKCGKEMPSGVFSQRSPSHDNANTPPPTLLVQTTYGRIQCKLNSGRFFS
uniref:Uncharacterized protein n=1 Tax=Aegilops tauschii subsp. strangulata TaxID=200361 RepID=A0A453AB00_AEGTS